MRKISEEQKLKARERSLIYYSANREKVLNRVKEYRKTERGQEVEKTAYLKRRNLKSEQIKANFSKWYESNSQRVIDSAKKWRKGNPLINQFHHYTGRARKKGLAFDFDKETFLGLIQEDCVYCGQSNPCGADRLDSSIGYTKVNTIPCCKNCNRMKLDHSLEDFLSFVKRIHSHLEL